MIMTSVLGHVKELDFSPEYGNWSLTPPDSLFDAEVFSKVADVRDKNGRGLQGLFYFIFNL